MKNKQTKIRKEKAQFKHTVFDRCSIDRCSNSSIFIESTKFSLRPSPNFATIQYDPLFSPNLIVKKGFIICQLIYSMMDWLTGR